MAKLSDYRCFQGETLTADFNVDAATTAVNVTLKDGTNEKTIAATKAADGFFKFSASPQDLDGFAGLTRWLALATAPTGVTACGAGNIYIRPLVSKWREYVTAMDVAIESWGTNPNQTVTVGELSITCKTLGELMNLRATYEARAKAEEAGASSASFPRKVNF